MILSFSVAPLSADHRLLQMRTARYARDEIIRQQQDFLARGGKFVVPIPDLEIVSN